MSHAAVSTPTAPGRALEAILLAAMFAVAHTQSPLYYSNQNQYLLHGAALAGHGHLEHDWLANTKDPTPLFSALVVVAYLIHPGLLHVAYFALLMGYFLAARWLVAAVPGFPDTRAARVAFAGLLTAAHAAILRWASLKFTGVDYPWYLQAGLAAQYLLGPGIQPSAFGVLLLAAVAAFAHDRPFLACVLAAGTCWFHATYLLPVALLVIGFLVELRRQNRGRTALVGGAVALMVVAPLVVLLVVRFDAIGEDATRASFLLARVRIPHHCVPARWFDPVAGLQLLWVTLGLLFLRRSPLGSALAVAALGAALLTAVQIATGSNALALMFPWRVSVVLVPVATVVIAGKALNRWHPGRWAERGSLAALVALAAGGVVVMMCNLGYRTADEEELYAHIRANAKPTDVYLLPVQFPAVGSGRGAVSNTFAPPPRAKEGSNQIPVDLQRFRLATGACIYVDFKSVPYAPSEVLEWNRRMEFAQELAKNGTWDAPGRREELLREGITHIAWPAAKPLEVGYLAPVRSASGYTVYEVK